MDRKHCTSDWSTIAEPSVPLASTRLALIMNGMRWFPEATVLVMKTQKRAVHFVNNCWVFIFLEDLFLFFCLRCKITWLALETKYLKCCKSGFTAKLQVTKRLGLILFPKTLYVFPHNNVMFVLNNKWALFLICCAMERFSLAHIRAGSIFTHFLWTFGCICFLQFSPGL